MKEKNHLVLLIVLAGLVGCTTTTSPLAAVLNPDQPAIPTETRSPQQVGLDMAIATPDLAEMNTNRWTSISPDGQWVAEGVVAFHKENIGGQMYYTGLILRSADGKRQWTIIDEWAEEGLGWAFPQPVRWSKDGRSFYYTNVPRPDGCSGPFTNGSDLQKVDLDSGIAVEVLPSSGLSIALSPDERTIAYRGYGRRGLVLRNLASGLEHELPVDPGKDYAAKIVWSPDSKSLAITLAIGACDTVGDGESTSILLVDTVSLAVQMIVSEDKRYFVAEEWPEPGTLVLKDLRGNRWIWDAKSGEITQQ